MLASALREFITQNSVPKLKATNAMLNVLLQIMLEFTLIGHHRESTGSLITYQI